MLTQVEPFLFLPKCRVMQTICKFVSVNVKLREKAEII